MVSQLGVMDELDLGHPVQETVTFEGNSGVVDFNSYDATLQFGSGQRAFTIAISRSSSDTVWVYGQREGARRLAILNFGRIEEVTEEAVENALFTGEARTVGEGNIIAFRNEHGAIALVHLLKLLKGGQFSEQVSMKFAEFASRTMDDEESKVKRSVIIAHLRRQSSADITALSSTARALAISLSHSMEHIAPPNEPAQLDAYESVSSLVKQAADGLEEIADRLEILSSNQGDEHQRAKVAEAAIGLKETFSGWLQSHQGEVVGYISNLSLLTAGCGVLGLCGAPEWMALSASFFLLMGRELPAK